MKKRRVTTGKLWIQRGPIVPWMREYIQWLAVQPSAILSQPTQGMPVRRGPPTTITRTIEASRCARRKIDARMLRDLEQRKDIIDYFDKLRADVQFRARELMERDVARNIELRREGLEAAAEAKDHRAIKGYTDWVPDVAFPKKTDEKPAAPRITINIGASNPETKALLGKVLGDDADIQDVEYEIIEPKQLESGEDEE